MRLLTSDQLQQVSAGLDASLPITTTLPYVGERTFTDGFWNGASAVGPTLGYFIGGLSAIVLYPLHLFGVIDINSHLRPVNNTTC